MKRSLSDWLSWQEQLHLSEIDLGLDRISQVAKKLQLLELPCQIISVAGTNGKGSTTAMLQAIYQQAGYKTGVYTSPHILRYNERISISGHAASDDLICAAFEKIDHARSSTSLTYFEFGTLAAALLFAEQKVDVAIFEVGLGGRLDAVNLWDADLAIITTIDLDHQSWLGNNRETIAVEKAGIMRQARPVVIGESTPPAALHTEAERIGATLIQRDQDFTFEINPEDDGPWRWIDLKTKQSITLSQPSLKGQFQRDNAASVVAAIMALQTTLPVSNQRISLGLQNTVLPGRLQLISSSPDFIVDVAHNPQAAQQLAEYLQHHPIEGRNIAIFSVLKDKDIVAIVEHLKDSFAEWHLVTINDARGLTANEIEDKLSILDTNTPITLHNNFKNCVQHTKNIVKYRDRIVAFGSFMVVSGVLESL